MKLVVFGATGPTGHLVVKQALGQGHDVWALVRDPEKMASLVQHNKLKIEKVDLTKEEEVTPLLKGKNAVLSCLGGRAGIWNPCSIYTDSITTITGAMKKAGVKRLVCITSWGTKDEAGLPWIISYFLKPTFLRNVLANMSEMEDFIKEKTPDINYTVIRPPSLVNKPDSGKEIRTREGQFVENASTQLSREDLARFMLSCLTVDKFDKKMVAVAVEK